MKFKSKVYVFEDLKNNKKLVPIKVKKSSTGAYSLSNSKSILTRASGSGYDKHSAVLAYWLSDYYQERLKVLVAPITNEEKQKGLFGLRHVSHINGTDTYLKRIPKNKREDSRYTSHIIASSGGANVLAIAKAIGLKVLTYI